MRPPEFLPKCVLALEVKCTALTINVKGVVKRIVRNQMHFDYYRDSLNKKAFHENNYIT